jgi:endo-1,4-beta-xylanase
MRYRSRLWCLFVLVVLVGACAPVGGREAWVAVEGGEDLTEHPSWQCVQSVDVVEGSLVVQAGSEFVTAVHGQGPYIEAEGDFGLAATVRAKAGDTAAIVAYGVLPQGEWWQGVRRLDFGLGAEQVGVHYWDGKSPNPALARYHSVPKLSGEVHLEMRKTGNTLSFWVDGHEVGRIRDPGAFPNGEVYLGANVAPRNRLTIEDLAIKAPAGREDEVRIVDMAGSRVAVPEGEPLRELIQAHGLHIGAAVGPSQLRCEPAYAEVLGREFDMLTTENALKFGPVHPAPSSYDWEDADKIIEYAEEHGMRVRGHTLVWHRQLPSWVEKRKWTREELIEVLHEHITTVVGRYRGRIAAWDVVNEAVEDDGSLRDTIWLRVIGPEYIEMAFRWAHEADPEARLFYNDYSCEDMGCKSDAVYTLVEGLVDKGVPIHGVGWQMHVALGSSPKPDDVRANLERLGGLGLEVQITEMDVRVRDSKPRTLERQADVYADMMQACLDADNCTAFVLWGFTDRHSWVPGFFEGWGWALVFDEEYGPKPAYRRLQEALAP